MHCVYIMYIPVEDNNSSVGMCRGGMGQISHVVCTKGLVNNFLGLKTHY